MSAPFDAKAFRETCICPDNWCPVHATCGGCGTHVLIDDPDSLAFCPSCGHNVLPAGEFTDVLIGELTDWDVIDQWIDNAGPRCFGGDQ